jgi:riboflavin kinase/FMN adenylyltransferase
MKSIVLALGYFDALHLGHQSLIQETVKQAKILNADPYLFTFNGDLGAFLNKTDGVVFTLTERLNLLKNFGIDNVFLAPLNSDYLGLSKKDFLDDLNSKFNIKAYVCGDDFKFGFKAQGDTNYLLEYAKTKNQQVFIKSEVAYLNDRVSTSRIKKLLKQGDICKVNALLGFDYHVTGDVIHGRGVGKTLQFPTVNLDYNKDKFALKNGVYVGYTVVDGKKYNCIINYGCAPTFDVGVKLEAHLIGFAGDLYGKTLTIYFNKFLREIVKFSNATELIKQLQKDIKSV